MTERETTEIKYETASLDDVVYHFASGFELEGKQIRLLRFWIDPDKREFVFKLAVSDEMDEAQSSEAV